MTERGEWRALYKRLLVCDRYRQLSPPARLCLVTLKLELPALGIAAVPAWRAILAEYTGLDAATVAAAVDELVATGWVRIDGCVIWLVNGLEHESQLRASDVKHRKAVAKLLGNLPKSVLVEEFRAHYPDWFAVPGEAKPEDPSKTLPRVSEGFGGGGGGKEGGAGGNRREARRRRRGKPPEPPAREVPPIWQEVKHALRGGAITPIADVLPEALAPPLQLVAGGSG